MSKQQDSHPEIDDLSIAVVHGNYVGRGGGEHVAEMLARTFNAPLYYGLGFKDYEPTDIKCHSLFNDHYIAPFIKQSTGLRDLFYMIKFRSVPELLQYDVIIQSGNEPGWYKPLDDQVVVKYTHSTPRNAYDRYPSRAPGEGFAFELYTFATEQLYQPVIPYPDLYVANSEVIERRLRKYWDKKGDDVTVVYPPVSVKDFGPECSTQAPSESYYLVLDRLVPAKHIDEIINAFREHSDKQLIIAGTGSEEDTLKRQSSNLTNVDFVGYVSEARKYELLAGAEALVYGAEDEDFGIVPVEAFASGTPVIGPREGFTEYQIDDGRTGILYDRHNNGVVTALDRFETEGVEATKSELQSEANKYSVNRFKQGMYGALRDAVSKVRIDK